MATSVWKGVIGFGLVSIPVRITTAARSETISFHMLHDKCGGRIGQKTYCKACNKDVERTEVLKGYEFAPEQYVVVSGEELDEIAPDSSRTLDITQFIRTEEIDPVYFDASYHIAPEDMGRKAYALLHAAMLKTRQVAIGKLAMHNREYLVAIRPGPDGLMMHTLFYADEIRANDLVGMDSVKVDPAERKLAEQLVLNLSRPFEPKEFQDAYKVGVVALIAEKQAGMSKGRKTKKVTPMPAPKDLMETLRASLVVKKTKKAGAA